MQDKLVYMLNKHKESALETIMDQYTPLVNRIIYNISDGVLTKEDIEETVTDVFVTLWKIQEGKLKGYLCTIAKTKALNKYKSSVLKRTDPIEDDEDFEADFSIEFEAEKTILVRY